jgi:hypothetical protein
VLGVSDQYSNSTLLHLHRYSTHCKFQIYFTHSYLQNEPLHFHNTFEPVPHPPLRGSSSSYFLAASTPRKLLISFSAVTPSSKLLSLLLHYFSSPPQISPSSGNHHHRLLFLQTLLCRYLYPHHPLLPPTTTSPSPPPHPPPPCVSDNIQSLYRHQCTPPRPLTYGTAPTAASKTATGTTSVPTANMSKIKTKSYTGHLGHTNSLRIPQTSGPATNAAQIISLGATINVPCVAPCAITPATNRQTTTTLKMSLETMLGWCRLAARAQWRRGRGCVRSADARTRKYVLHVGTVGKGDDDGAEGNV